jgi:hypothetical protein
MSPEVKSGFAIHSGSDRPSIAPSLPETGLLSRAAENSGRCNARRDATVRSLWSGSSTNSGKMGQSLDISKLYEGTASAVQAVWRSGVDSNS